MEEIKPVQVDFFGKKTTNEALDKATIEELKTWSKRIVTFLLWYFIIKSVLVYWIDNDQTLAILYSLLSIAIGTSNRINSLEEKLKTRGLI